MDQEQFDGALFHNLLIRFQDYHRKTYLLPHNLLKLNDQNGGQLSLTGIDLIHSLDRLIKRNIIIIVFSHQFLQFDVRQQN